MKDLRRHEQNGEEQVSQTLQDPFDEPGYRESDETHDGNDELRDLRALVLGHIFFGRRAELARGEHRDQGQRHEERNGQRESDRQSLIAKELARDAFDEDDRDEDTDGRHRAGDDRLADFARARARGFDELEPVFSLSLDGFEHDDRVVHEKPDAERDSAERHDVERDTRDEHEKKRRHDRDGDRDTDDDRRLQVPQKEHEDHDREPTTDERGLQHFGDRLAYVTRLVRDELELETFAETLEPILEKLHTLFDGLRDRNGVRAPFLVDRDLDRFAAIDAAYDLALFVATRDERNVFETDVGARAVDDDVAHVRRALELVDGANEIFRLPILKPSARQVHVLGRETRNHLCDAHS